MWGDPLTFIESIIDKITGIFPKTNINVNIDISNKKEYLTKEYRISNPSQLEVCYIHTETIKRTWPLSDRKFITHRLPSGCLEHYELGNNKQSLKTDKKEYNLLETPDAKD
jgi:hypothetical protein